MTQMRYLYVLAALLLSLLGIPGCSGDTTASEQKAEAPAAAAAKTASMDFAELSALRPRDRTPEQDVQLAAYLTEVGRKEEAFATLADAAVKGYSDIKYLRTEPKFAPLRSDDRWQQVELFVDVNGSQGSLPDVSKEPPQQVRPPAPPPGQVNIPAPDWSLTDAAGKVVKLSDLRGKTVIMDFWATWCGPCKRSMPELDKFTRQYASENLVVLSVNVWERSTDVALEWYKEQGYAMKLLFGGRDLTTAYEVQGIPHLCLIDPEGIIRYSQPGFHPQVLDHLLKLTGIGAKEG
jgi:thiol-disulfide isomerase/thioredoxin